MALPANGVFTTFKPASIQERPLPLSEESWLVKLGSHIYVRACCAFDILNYVLIKIKSNRREIKGLGVQLT